jgi:hypothetical protein
MKEITIIIDRKKVFRNSNNILYKYIYIYINGNITYSHYP